jgi:REP element-mobilizing transposase RayT
MYPLYRRRSLPPALFMFWQRYLPHYTPEGHAVFVTWRLAGSIPIPPAKLLKNDPNPGKAFADFDRKLDRSRFGPRWLGDTRVANMFVSALQDGAHTRRAYDPAAWVVMPNHVYIVIQPHEPLSEIMRWLKSTTANRANKILGQSGSPFWQREYYDHWTRSGKELTSVVAYVERNPVSAGLVAAEEDWPWSSARKSAGGKTASGTVTEK